MKTDATFKYKIQEQTNLKIELAHIKKEFWSIPNWINKRKLDESVKKIGRNINYRHMCRFYSGFFFDTKKH